ncbi:site-specific integrase [Ottowia sp.]|uniref:site-specific integrase n=1 Tax=Ottowia sp. TaxID=1898956 RepID=UPI00261856CA|nr:site-specific integrase [Ottowia sp.]
MSIDILKAVLAGGTYDGVATTHGLTRTAIEHRTKRLAKLLQRQVGIAGLNPEATGYVYKLRASRVEVEAALSRFEAGETAREVPVQVLSDKDVQMMIHRAGLRNPKALRDMALIHIVLATGARPLEVARLEISDYLHPDGTVRSCSEMRAGVSVNRKARPLFFGSAPAIKAIDAYLEHRILESGLARDSTTPYRGFSPDSRLFLNDAGLPYVVHYHEVEGRPRFLCRQMLDSYRKIFKRINMHGLSALTLRRTVACRLDARGADEEQIGLILGITEKQAVRELLPQRPSMIELMTDLYTDADFPMAQPLGDAQSDRIAG